MVRKKNCHIFLSHPNLTLKTVTLFCNEKSSSYCTLLVRELNELIVSPIISVRNLHTQFGKQVVHEDVDLEIFPDEILTIVGGSGSGKSVLFRYLIHIALPQAGEIIYHKDVQSGILFQNGGLISSLTVLENVLLPLTEGVKQWSYGRAAKKAKESLVLVGLSRQDFDKFPSQLSGGMIKRVGIARAMVTDPKILFLDEPTSGLDPVSAGDFDDLILDLKKKLGLTCVMITHDLNSIFTISDRIGVLVDKKMTTGTLEQIVKNPNPWIQTYFNGDRALPLRRWKGI